MANFISRRAGLILSAILLSGPSVACADSGSSMAPPHLGPLLTGCERTESYFDMLLGKRVGIMTNHTAIIDGIHIVDSLQNAGIDLQAVFAPEHGFRGDADAGEHVGSYTDVKTGVQVISAYGANKKPAVKDVSAVDIMLFDIQDVGLRYYTYLSSMHYLMETCAEAGVPLIVLDRPNPNGMYVDGPILNPKHTTFVGMHPIPVVHGMTLGELARMINGEGWLEGNLECDLTVISCSGYDHSTFYELPLPPSPNLPNMRSVYLYPSLCYFEGTVVSIGRGTEFPFQVWGHPDIKEHDFSFIPESRAGAKNPPLLGKTCYGQDLRATPSDSLIIASGIDLNYVIDAYNNLKTGDKFFNRTFELLIGVDYVRDMIKKGHSASEIKAMWAADVDSFLLKRKPYLLYEE